MVEATNYSNDFWSEKKTYVLFPGRKPYPVFSRAVFSGGARNSWGLVKSSGHNGLRKTCPKSPCSWMCLHRTDLDFLCEGFFFSDGTFFFGGNKNRLTGRKPNYRPYLVVIWGILRYICSHDSKFVSVDLENWPHSIKDCPHPGVQCCLNISWCWWKKSCVGHLKTRYISGMLITTRPTRSTHQKRREMPVHHSTAIGPPATTYIASKIPKRKESNKAARVSNSSNFHVLYERIPSLS